MGQGGLLAVVPIASAALVGTLPNRRQFLANAAIAASRVGS
jgi:hypothetical protein